VILADLSKLADYYKVHSLIEQCESEVVNRIDEFTEEEGLIEFPEAFLPLIQCDHYKRVLDFTQTLLSRDHRELSRWLIATRPGLIGEFIAFKNNKSGINSVASLDSISDSISDSVPVESRAIDVGIVDSRISATEVVSAEVVEAIGAEPDTTAETEVVPVEEPANNTPEVSETAGGIVTEAESKDIANLGATA
jgi:hypothetical protein